MSLKASDIQIEKCPNIFEDAEQGQGWVNETIFEKHSDVFDLLLEKGGGCGTFATYLCAEQLGMNITMKEIDKAFHSLQGTTDLQRNNFFDERGFCSLTSELKSCSSYFSIAKAQDRGCQVTVQMGSSSSGHVEFLSRVDVSKKMKSCSGITNSWGRAALIEGNSGAFYHSRLNMFCGKSGVTFTTICPCSDENLSMFVDNFVESLKDPNSAYIKGSSLVSAIKILLKTGLSPERIAEILRESNKNLDGTIYEDRTALLSAMMEDYLDIIHILILAGVDLNKQADWGVTPLYSASEDGKTGIVRMLVDSGADLNKQNEKGRTPLSIATYYGHVDIVRILVDAKADHNIPNKWGKTPLFIAVENGRKEIVQILVDAKADPNVMNFENRTPLEFAMNNNTEIATILLKAVASRAVE